MKITRNVLNDLLPVYLSGEASPDTCALIEESLRSDPDFARLVEAQKKDLTNQDDLLKGRMVSLAPDRELQTLGRTKAMLERRKWLMALALMFTVFPFSFMASDSELRFLLLHDQPRVAAACWILAAVFWGLHLQTRSRLKSSGL